ncbi:DUF1638 domain-containing protein [Anaeroarcus burkinensis]|uniref:DUF1638 domain-containing protein n=1 Tax=Anaeroarcus burkinensis TaxID=82376 RepID=UPI0004061404|nr:DUF1638 domain-containing protein [Anaeroarcus burkinensis]
MTTKLIACEVMRRELEALSTQHDFDCSFVSMDFHLYPQKLHQELQRLLDESNSYDQVLLSFGLCGGAAKGLHAVHCPLIMPRVHDCLALLLGSRQRLAQLQQEEKGTFYLTDGWLITERNILADHKRHCERHGEQKAKRLLARMFDSYTRVLFVHTGNAPEDNSLAESQRIAELLGLQHLETKGSDSYLQALLQGPWPEEDFLRIPQGSFVQEDDFFMGSMLPACRRTAQAI